MEPICQSDVFFLLKSVQKECKIRTVACNYCLWPPLGRDNLQNKIGRTKTKAGWYAEWATDHAAVNRSNTLK